MFASKTQLWLQNMLLKVSHVTSLTIVWQPSFMYSLSNSVCQIFSLFSRYPDDTHLRKQMSESIDSDIRGTHLLTRWQLLPETKEVFSVVRNSLNILFFFFLLYRNGWILLNFVDLLCSFGWMAKQWFAITKNMHPPWLHFMQHYRVNTLALVFTPHFYFFSFLILTVCNLFLNFTPIQTRGLGKRFELMQRSKYTCSEFEN